jgi:hypothetical protein
LVGALAYLAFPGSAWSPPSRLVVGSVARSDVIAPFRFLVLKDEAERALEAERLASTVRAIVTARPEDGPVAARAAAAFFAALDSAAAAGGAPEAVSRATGLSLRPEELVLLQRAEIRRRLAAAIVPALRRSGEGFLAPGVSAAELGREVVLRSGGSEHVVPADSVRTFSDFLQAAAAALPEGAGAQIEQTYVRLLGAFFRPTLVYQREETEARRDALRRTVDSVESVVLAGEKIVGAHEVVTPEAARRLEALRAELARRGRTAVSGVRSTLGGIGLNTLVVGLFGVVCLFYRPAVYRSWRALGFFAAMFAVVMAAAGLVARQAPDRTELIPVALPAFLLSVLFDGRIAAVAAMAIAVLVGVQPPLRGGDALFLCFAGGVAAALSVRHIRSRTQAYTSILVVAGVYAAAAVLAGAAAGESVSEIGGSAARGAVNAAGSAALAMLVLPLAETWTRSTTDLHLLELSDPNRPLLRRLATEAPGTYAHSVAMANLCEAACNAIGANGLLARVGCYYHDVGKLKHPQFFVENQGRGRNPHEQLTPAQSAAIIRRHVQDGLALADEHRLPEVIKRFIPEHHGTCPISYFLDKARGSAAAGTIREEEYHYPGPLPQSAETAVALLADAVEAALRVLDDATPEAIQRAIDRLITTRIEDGQLREAPLTMRQLETVRREFVRILSGMHHARVDYPEDAGGISADWEAARAD